MKHNRWLGLILGALLVVALACPVLADVAPLETEAPAQTEAPAAEATPEATPAAIQAPLTADTVLAVVNGVDLTYADIKPYYEALQQTYSAQVDITDAKVAQILKAAAIDNTARMRVVLDKGREKGLDQIADEKRQQIEATADSAYQNALSSVKGMFAKEGVAEEEQLKNAEAYLTSMGYTKEMMLEQYLMSDLYTTTMNGITEGLSVTDEQLRQLYDEKVAAAKDSYQATPGQYDTDALGGGAVYYTPEGVRAVKHILVKMDTAEGQQLKAYQAELQGLPEGDEKRAELEGKIKAIEDVYRPKLDEIQAKIDAGEDFQALIDEYGEDPGMKAGSAYAEGGYPVSQGSMTYDPPFTAAALALANVGDVSAPALGSYGYHFVRYDHELTAGPVAFDSVKAALSEMALAEKKTALQTEVLAQWTQDAGVQMFPERFTE